MDETLLDRAAKCCLGHQALRTARALTRHYNAALRPLDLQATQFGLLVAVQREPDVSLARLAGITATDPSTLARNVKPLERRGLIAVSGARGRAGKHLTLSESGRALLAEALPLWREAYDGLVEKLGVEGASTVLNAMVSLEKASKA